MTILKAGFKELGDTLQITVADKPILFIRKIQNDLPVNQYLVSTPDFKSFNSKSVVEIADDKYQMLRIMCKPDKFKEYISLDIFDEFVADEPFLKHVQDIDYQMVVGNLENEVNHYLKDKED